MMDSPALRNGWVNWQTGRTGQIAISFLSEESVRVKEHLKLKIISKIPVLADGAGSTNPPWLSSADNSGHWEEQVFCNVLR
jgi:hypothetical protein